MAKRRPNILLLTGDQHNADILGCYGNPVVQTPHLDALADSGMRFTRAFTPFPVCSPARVSMMTGLWAHHHGAVHNVNMGRRVPGLANQTPVITGILKNAGYTTALIGKKHMLMEHVPDMYFDHQMLVEGKCQFTANNEPDEYRRYLYSKGYGDEWKTWESAQYQREFWVVSPFAEEDHADSFIGRHAVEYLRRVGDQPFFLWVSFCSPHNTWDPPVPFDRLYDSARISMPRRKWGELAGKPARQAAFARATSPVGPGNTPDLGPSGLTKDSPGWGVFSAPDDPYDRVSESVLRGMLCAYYATVTLVDKQIGEILDTLQMSGKADDTLVVYTSDHGDYLGNNWLFYKAEFLYDSLVRVPLILSWPDHSPIGLVSDGLVSLVDLAPTFARAAGVADSVEFDGRDLFEGAIQDDGGFRGEIFSETQGSWMIRTDRWKLVEYKTGEGELYDLAGDPGEHDNLYCHPEVAHVATDLSRRLEQWRASGVYPSRRLPAGI